MGAAHRSDRSAGARTRRLRRRLIAYVLVPVVLLAAGAALNIGERMAYWPERDPFTTPDGYVDVRFTTEDGLALHGWFIPARGVEPGAHAPAIIHTHGNAGHIKNHAAFSRFLRDYGFHVLVFDYRGYGRSDDAWINRASLVTDTRAAYTYLRARPDVDPDRIGIFGHSLGGQPALQFAAREPAVRAVATLSTFSSWEGVAHDFAPVLGPLLMHEGLDAVDAVGDLGDRPYWIGHGGSDFIVDARHAPILARAAQDAGIEHELHTYPNGNHISLLWTHPECAESIAAFFERAFDNE